MAKAQINTKSSTYIKDREVFLKDLKQFNESKNLPVRAPVVNGIEIDLYLFYMLVQQRGGLGKVNQNDTWESFMRPLRLPHPCINGSTLLRRIYGTHLEKYERAKGPPGRDDDNDIDEDPRRGRGSAMPRITFSGGTYISASGEPLRTASKVAAPSERLALSLLSPMPNEQDFAVNVCTVLAADHSNRLPLSTTPHILDFLLAHVGVYNHSSLRDTIGRSYFEARGRYPDEFWRMRAGGGGAKELADETKFMQPGVEQPDLIVQAMAAHNTLTDCLMNNPEEDEILIEKMVEDEILEDWVTEPSEENQLFAPELPGGATCVYTQRVLQIASIVRSLSFHEENVQYLAKNTTLIRFLLLCANCWVGTLRQSGLDTLGNVSTELVIKDPATCLISRHVLSTIQSALVSQDRARVLAALELLNKLAQNEVNEDALLKSLEAKVYHDVCALLTLRDIMVLVCTLECVYALTSLGDRASESVARVPGLIHTLVSLVTVEAQSYGPRACILMRVVETVSGPNALAAQANADRDAQEKQQQQQSPVSTKQTPEPPQTTVAISVNTPTTTVSSSVAPVSTLQQSHLQQRNVQENENFAQAWLRSAYEVLPANDNSACDASEVYRQYAACCTKLGRKGLIAPTHFPRLVRSLFGGTVGPNTVTLSNGESQQVYIGIRARNTQNRTSPTTGPSSPILKAQLTNKPPASEVKPVVTQHSQPQVQPQQQSTTTHPHLSQALEPSPSNTTLIKHLLAHKVAQRQQSQQRGPITQNTVVLQQQSQLQSMELDPEALIKCTTITPGGVASSTPTASTEKVGAINPEDLLVPKEEPVQIQIDEQAQITIKTAQNKMLADLLKKNSNPPLQVVQMGPQINAPTIQITETGQIVQVKSESTPVIQFNADAGIVAQGNQFFQIKNEQGQLIQIKNEQGQIIQLKSEQLPPPMLQFKNEQGHIVQMKDVKNEKDIAEVVVTDHSYTEPPVKKVKVEEKRESNPPQESVSKTAANLYAALAASALEDEDDLFPPKQEPVDMIHPSLLMTGSGENASVIIQEPILQVQQPGISVQPPLQVQQPTLQVQQMQPNTIQVQPPSLQVQPPPLQVQQPMLQVQPMDVQNILASQSGQLILQEKTMGSQPTQFVQQPMQIIATPSTSQGGLSYIAQNLSGNMMQKTIIIVQGPTGGGPLTLTVNNPAGLDDATLNSLIAQATEAITQQQIIQNTPQITPSQQPIITTQPQPHKAQIVNPTQPQPMMVTQKQPPALISTSITPSTNQIVTSNPQIIQGNQQLLQGNQQIITVSNNQPIIVSSPMKPAVHRVVQNVQQPQRSPVVTTGQPSNQVSVVQTDGKTSVIQSTTKPQQPVMRQVITRQPVMVGNTKVGEKEFLVSQPVTVTEPKPATSKLTTPPPTATPQPIQPIVTHQDETPWICHWRGCGKTFTSSTEVFTHAARTHCPTTAGGEAPCLWLDCDRVPRKTFALLNHLTDKHCTPHALTAIYKSRRHATSEADGKPVSLGYPPNAALAALNKHAADMFNPRELMDENEGPVTKSIRLTAALILRNIVIYSNTGRRQLRSYEAHLATIALSNVEASRTIAQVLFDMNNI